MADSSVDTDVIVVGAGPTGLLLAGELCLGGARATVLEQLPAPSTASRASALHARTLEILDQRGLLEALGTVPCDRAGHFGGIRLDFEGHDSRFRGPWKVPQTRTERLLGDWAAGLGAVISRGHELVAMRQTERGVEAEALGPGGRVLIRAAYLVGCDGERSTVRRLAGIGFPGADATRELLAADVGGIDVPDRRFERHERGLAVANRRPDGITRVMVHEFGRAAAARGKGPEFAEVAEVWERVTGEAISAGEPVWVHAFRNARRLAARYRSGRVLLAGDAAHAQLPVGGQALNLGLQDAANLGWKLAAQIRGWAPDGLLDSYHEERHDVGRRVLADIEAQATLLLGGPEVEPLRTVVTELLGHEEVVEHLVRKISGLDIRYPSASDDPLVGRRLPHWELTTGDGRYSVPELLRDGRGVLLDAAADPAAGAPAGWAGRVRTVRAATPPGRAVLIRPDGYVAWADDGRTPLRDALHHWFGAPEQETP